MSEAFIVILYGVVALFAWVPVTAWFRASDLKGEGSDIALAGFCGLICALLWPAVFVIYVILGLCWCAGRLSEKMIV